MSDGFVPDAIVGSPSVPEDMRFQRANWIAERIGWAAMSVIVLAALLGVFSDGPLSQRSIASGPVTLEQQRFGRQLRGNEMMLALPASDMPVEVMLSDRLLEAMAVDSIEPRPDSSRAGAEGAVYSFPASAEPHRIRFDLRPRGPGTVRGEVRAAGRSLDFFQFVYP